MAEENTKIKIKLEVETEDCFSDFGNDICFPENYTIVKIPGRKYGIVDLKSKTCITEFESIFNVAKRTYLLYLADQTEIVVKFDYEEIFMSSKFKKVIKAFERYLLVIDMNDERQLVPLIYFQNLEFCKWPNCESNGAVKGIDNAIMNLPNGKKTILVKDGLLTTDIEFKHVIEKSCGNDILNSFRVVIFEDKTLAVIRINDLKASELFEEFDFINAFYYNYICTHIIIMKNNKKYILRISDFKTSEGYDDFRYLGSEIMVVTKDEKNYVMRLSDFAIAKWQEDE